MSSTNTQKDFTPDKFKEFEGVQKGGRAEKRYQKEVEKHIEFEDKEIKNLDLKDVDIFSRLIIEYLCGEKHYQPLSDDDKILMGELLNKATKERLNYEQFNELLLLLNQDKVGKDFFERFFGKGTISLEDLRQGVIKFRGFAMLCFGNFRFAYKQLIKESENELKKKLTPYEKKSSDLVKEFKNRPPNTLLEIEEIERDKTWYLGEISGAKTKQTPEYEEVQKKALKNTEVYLTWDYMDIYIATSMRNKWEFEETFDFIRNVFNDTDLKGLNLRYYDPTQCKCKNSRDKGLVEGLMLKRVLCTIYLAQESDTMGKDSELAATLAQSKPVIAYVPQYKSQDYSKKIKEYPLKFFKARLLILDAERILDADGCVQKLKKIDQNFKNIIYDFFQNLENPLKPNPRPLSLWDEKDDEEFRQNYENFPKICQILAIAECFNFDKRAKVLKELHPLSMQVDLQSGVANGVLVVRNAKQCAKLLYRVLTNSVKFRIKNRKVSEKEDSPISIKQPPERIDLDGVTILEEVLSGSPYRVVTDNERLTNSFWNLFT